MVDALRSFGQYLPMPSVIDKCYAQARFWDPAAVSVLSASLAWPMMIG